MIVKTLPVLEVRWLSIVRGDVKILRGMNWRVESGQHWAILGSNGSGKTSLLSALCGYFAPTSGTISLFGHDFGESDWRELRTLVGLVSSCLRQSINDDETALEVVVSGRYATINHWGRITTADTRAAKAILKRVEAAHLADRFWGVLSQGERQRVLIGRALMARPKLLILDEPCAGLDPVSREYFLAFVERMTANDNCPTLLFVTHHVEEITPSFTHTLLLRKGVVSASGPIGSTLNSGSLSRAFKAPLRLTKRNGRYRLSFHS